MTLQEQIDSHRTVVYHGHENGETLLSFDDEKEIYRFSDKEVDMVVDRYKTPEQLELDRKMKETSNLVFKEMINRKLLNIEHIAACYLFMLFFIGLAIIGCFDKQYLKALWLVGISLLGLIPLPKLFHTRKVIVGYFENHKEG